MPAMQLKIGSHSVPVTHPEKVLFPDDAITKEEFVEYHRRIAPVMVPHMRGRPVTLYRFHGLVQGEGFYQQQIPTSAPEWVNRVTVKKEGGTTTHVVCDDAATLVYLANQNCITLHTWLSRMDKLENPDQMIFDLDPTGEDFEPVRQGARLLKSLLDEWKLTSFLKTTGSHGLHVVIPLLPSESFETVRFCAREIANLLTQREPRKYTTEQRKEKRQDRLFVDTLRNTYGHTAVAPYSVRAKRGAPIAAPLFWEELNDPDLTAGKYNIRNILTRLQRDGDPWKGMKKQGQDIKPLLRHFKS